MTRIALFLLTTLLAAAPAAAQDYAGTWTAKHPSGGGVTLTLEQAAEGQLTGTLEGNSNRFEVAAEVKPEGLIGLITGNQVMVYLVGQLSGAQLRVSLLEPGPGGEPNMQSRRDILFSRAAGEGSAAPRRKPEGELAQLRS